MSLCYILRCEINFISCEFIFLIFIDQFVMFGFFIFFGGKK